jgi:effector-binding domain-containing protein
MFSKFSQVPVKTLRYYDQIGLFQPAEIDPFTGYRYYSASQLPRINRILALKDLGLSLEQVALLVNQDLSPDQIRGMLRLKQVEIQERLDEERARLARVEQRLKQMEQEETMPTQEVAVKSIPAQAVASVRDTIALGDLGQLFGELFGYLGQRGIAPTGAPVGIYHSHEFSESAMDVEVAAPVAAEPPSAGRVSGRTLPAVNEMACVVHQGGYDTIGGTYGQVMAWIEANGYQVAGPTREVYIQGPESGDDASTYITEVQVPVVKSGQG